MTTILLKAKQQLINTGPGRLLGRVRWWAGAWQRLRHPELWDMYLEDRRLGVALDALLRPDSNCLDVGAHIGSTLARLEKASPRGRHWAIEADPAKARSLQQRFPDVKVFNTAVGEESGRAVLHRARHAGFSSLQPPVGQEVVGEVEVEVSTLDDLLGDVGSIDFVKLDVEGAELPALRGAGRLIKNHRPVILFECGPTGLTEAFGYGRGDLYHHLRDLDYRVYSIVDFVYGRSDLTAEEFDKAGTYPYRGFNYLAVPPEHPVTRLL